MYKFPAIGTIAAKEKERAKKKKKTIGNGIEMDGALDDDVESDPGKKRKREKGGRRRSSNNRDKR